MISVLVEVETSGGAGFRMSVRAENIRRAVSIAEAHYPGSGVRVVYPIDPEMFFVKNSALALGLVEMPEQVAG